jgi:hypothetical protein
MRPYTPQLLLDLSKDYHVTAIGNGILPSCQCYILTRPYWKTNASIQSAVALDQGTNRFQISFTRRPAEPGVTYHVQASADLTHWSDIATYAGTNIVVTSQAAEISRSGSPNEIVTIRDTYAMASQTRRFLRMNVTKP